MKLKELFENKKKSYEAPAIRVDEFSLTGMIMTSGGSRYSGVTISDEDIDYGNGFTGTVQGSQEIKDINFL